MKNIFIHLGIIFILVGFSLIFIDHASAQIKNYYNDIEASKEIIENVNILYDEFKNDIIDVKKSIVDTSILYNVYFDDFTTKNKTILSKINEVKEKINDIDLVSIKLVNNCRYNLNDKSMNSKCNNFKINYENMYSSYQTMVNQYNNIVDAYNVYATKKHLRIVEKLDNTIESSKKVISVIE